MSPIHRPGLETCPSPFGGIDRKTWWGLGTPRQGRLREYLPVSLRGGTRACLALRVSIKELRAGPHRLWSLAPYAHGQRATFEPEAGKVVYLGEWHVRVSCETFPAKVAIQVTDPWERDGRLFQ